MRNPCSGFIIKAGKWINILSSVLSATFARQTPLCSHHQPRRRRGLHPSDAKRAAKPPGIGRIAPCPQLTLHSSDVCLDRATYHLLFTDLQPFIVPGEPFSPDPVPHTTAYINISSHSRFLRRIALLLPPHNLQRWLPRTRMPSNGASAS